MTVGKQLTKKCFNYQQQHPEIAILPFYFEDSNYQQKPAKAAASRNKNILFLGFFNQ